MTTLSYMAALPVPSPWREELSQLQDRLRPVGWRITIGPHVTLVAPGRATTGLRLAADPFTQAMQGVQGLDLTYPALGTFRRRGLATIFMKPVASHELYELQRKLEIVAASWQDVSRSLRRPFVPHVTLVNRLPEVQMDSVIRQLEHLVPASITFGRPRLFAKLETDTEWLEIA